MLTQCNLYTRHFLNLWWRNNGWEWWPGFPGGASGKESACQFRRHKRCGFNPWVRKIPGRRACKPTPVSLPRESVDRGAWQAIVSGVSESRTLLRWLSMPPRRSGDWVLCYGEENAEQELSGTFSHTHLNGFHRIQKGRDGLPSQRDPVSFTETGRRNPSQWSLFLFFQKEILIPPRVGESISHSSVFR